MGELDPHNERDNDINRVYKSFCIVRGDVSKNQTLSTWQGKTNIKNPCLKIMGESGWHMPNQAELSIIYLVGTDASAYGEYSKGKFSGLKGKQFLLVLHIVVLLKVAASDSMAIDCLKKQIYL